MNGSNRSEDWYRQAENDLAWGKHTLAAGFYSQVCFICQQASEKALKALAYARGVDLVKGHSVRGIAKSLGFNDEIEKAGQVLDQYYISARYPDALPEGAPFEFYTEEQATDAIALAQSILNRVTKELNDE